MHIHIYIYNITLFRETSLESKRSIIKKVNRVTITCQIIKFKLFINNLQNLHVYTVSVFFRPVQRHVCTRKNVSRYERRMAETVRNEGTKEEKRKRKRRFPVVGRRGTREKRAKKRKCCKAWERASPLAERGHTQQREREREDFTNRGYASILHRKPTPTFTLAARPDDSMLKDGRLAG